MLLPSFPKTYQISSFYETKLGSIYRPIIHPSFQVMIPNIYRHIYPSAPFSIPPNTHHPPNMILILLCSTILLSPFLLSSSVLAHQSISWPTPITRDVACRISSNANCPGPCPRKFRRYDQTPNNPSVTVRRGSFLKLHTLANNHRGGFSRWSLVHVRHMHSKRMHKRNAFLYTCADLRVTKCSRSNKKRDCNYDLRNEYYRHKIRIPRNVPDGIYVLGWVWFGGGLRWGSFGDYYDCMFIQVKGGPLRSRHKPVFKPGPSATGRREYCVATVNRPGICWREPCPGGGRRTSYLKPKDFSRGRRPKPIPKSRYKNPYKLPKRRKHSPRIKSLTIRSADYPGRVLAKARSPKFFHILLTKAMRTTVTCEVTGNVKRVTFYINGNVGRTDTSAPFSIAGDWIEYRSQQVKYAPWAFNIGRTYITVSCKAVGYDGVEQWLTVELSTFF